MNVVKMAAVIGLFVSVIGVPVAGYAIGTQGPTDRSDSGRGENHTRYLRGSLHAWSGTEIKTSVGDYSVANIYVDDRASAKDKVFEPGKEPKIQLEFFYNQLQRVRIYR